MSYLLTGIVLILISFLSLLMSIQYTMIYWYDQRLQTQKLSEEFLINLVTKQTEQTENESINNKQKKIKFGLDFISAFNTQDRRIVPVKTAKIYPNWLLTLAIQWDLFKKQTWSYIPNLIAKLLGKPSIFPLKEQKEKEKEKEEEKEKVQNLGKQIQNESKNKLQDLNLNNTKPTPLDISKKNQSKNIQNIQTENNTKDWHLAEKQTKNMATIALVGEEELEENENTDQTEEQKIYRQIEKKILAKLKSKLNDYEIWLELGDLYAKYKEYDKAREVYSLILKHGTGEIKVIATNRLIGLA